MPRKQLLRIEKPASKVTPKTPPMYRPSQLIQVGAGHPLLRLQRAVGNRAIGGLVQAKLVINQPGDRYEQEADWVADQVMRMPTPAVQRQLEPEEEEEATGPIQTKPLVGRITPLVQRQCAACASGQGLCPSCAEEQNEIQRKPLASTITPLIQRQGSEELEEEAAAETLRPKAASGTRSAPDK